MDKTKVTIYILRDPYTYDIRYVGRTKNRLNVRLNGHVSKAKKYGNNNYKNCWLNSLNKRPIIEEVNVVEGWKYSHLVEKDLIKLMLEEGVKLVNLDDKGEGGLNKIITKEQRNKISEKLKEFYSDGTLPPNSKDVTIFDLKGNRIKYFKTLTSCAEYIGINNKHIQNSLKRGDKRLKTYQLRLGDLKENIEPYVLKKDYSFNEKRVFSYDKFLKKYTEYKSIIELAESLEMPKSNFHYYKNKDKFYRDRYLFHYNKEVIEKRINNLKNNKK